MKIGLIPITAVSFTILLLASTLAIFTVTQSENVSGLTATASLKVYRDYRCTQRIYSISWGDLEPGDSITKTVYVKNTGSVALTLHLYKTNWSPTTANESVTITWNRENTLLYPYRVTTARLTLTVSQDIQENTTFRVNLVIRGVSR